MPGAGEVRVAYKVFGDRVDGTYAAVDGTQQAMRVNGEWHNDVIGAVNREYELAGRRGGIPQDVVITAVDRNGNESTPAYSANAKG